MILRIFKYALTSYISAIDKVMIILFISLFVFCSCEKDDDLMDTDLKFDLRFVPTDVIVKTKGYYTIDKVFDFINSFDHDVGRITSRIYTSALPPDSLSYVFNYIIRKTYTNDGGNKWFLAYVDYDTKIITILPKLYDIKNKDNQSDWLQTKDILKLSEETDIETSANKICFHVPEGQEKEWVKKFEKYDFVIWAKLNYIVEINPWP